MNASNHLADFRSSSAPVDSRVLQVANGGNGDGSDCTRSNTSARPAFPRLSIDAVNYKGRCFLPTSFCSLVHPRSLAPLLTKPTDFRSSFSPLHPTDRQSIPSPSEWPPLRAIPAAQPRQQPRSPLLENLAPRRRSTAGSSGFQVQSFLPRRSVASLKTAIPTSTMSGRGPIPYRAWPLWSLLAFSPRFRPSSSPPHLCAAARPKPHANRLLTTTPNQRSREGPSPGNPPYNSRKPKLRNHPSPPELLR